jgi:hypothetical protein
MPKAATLGVLVFIALGPIVCSAQSVSLVADPLTITSSRSIEAPFFPYFGESQCDSDGNMYFHSGNAGYRFGEIFELSRDGSKGKFFRPSGRFADPETAEFNGFWVSAGGEVFVLVSGAGRAYILKFDDNGVMQDPLALQVPENVYLADLAVFDSGYIFLAGNYTQKTASHRQGEGYQAIFSPSGEVARTLSLGVPDLDFLKAGLTDGGVASARGNLYFLGPTQISVLSPGGTVRKVPYQKPDPRSVATKIYLSGGTAVIVLNLLGKTGPDDRIARRYLVVDAETGKAKAYYEAPGLNWSDVCLSREQELVFLGLENKKQNIMTARIW